MCYAPLQDTCEAAGAHVLAEECPVAPKYDRTVSLQALHISSKSRNQLKFGIMTHQERDCASGQSQSCGKDQNMAGGRVLTTEQPLLF